MMVFPTTNPILVCRFFVFVLPIGRASWPVRARLFPPAALFRPNPASFRPNPVAFPPATATTSPGAKSAPSRPAKPPPGLARESAIGHADQVSRERIFGHRDDKGPVFEPPDGKINNREL